MRFSLNNCRYFLYTLESSVPAVWKASLSGKGEIAKREKGAENESLSFLVLCLPFSRFPILTGKNQIQYRIHTSITSSSIDQKSSRTPACSRIARFRETGNPVFRCGDSDVFAAAEEVVPLL